jgi:uptake hydrogenase small subunit
MMPDGGGKNLLWLQSGGCGGCTLSLLCAEGPDFVSAFDTAGINILWHPSLSEETGREVSAIIDRILADETRLDILCLEGSVMMGPNKTGRFHMMPGRNEPMKDVIASLAAKAAHVVGVGSCAAFGGITTSGGNPGGACGLAFDDDKPGGLLGGAFKSGADLPVVNIPGCPVHPDWVTETLANLTAGAMTADSLDAVGRPHSISGGLVHHGCSRNEFYEYKASAEKLCHAGCMMENLGCKGTQAAGDCNTRAWNGSGSCISGGYPCIACTEPGFEKPGHPFVETPKIAGIPVGLPTDMPKAWFVALASLSKAATPRRLRENATSDRLRVFPDRHKKGNKS